MSSVSIIIVNYNGGDHLERCLDCLFDSTFVDFDVFIVDNCSTDHSLGSIQEKYQKLLEDKIHIIALGKNTGFAHANNIGIAESTGKWVCLLNADAYVTPNWLELLLLAAKDNPEYGFFGSHQINFSDPNLMDGTGDMYARNGRAWRRDFRQPRLNAVQENDEVFGACAAAAMYQRRILEEAGGFDEDFFCYFEDVDLSFRLRLLGNRCLHVANALVHHVGSGSVGGDHSEFALYHGYRNSFWTFIKNMPGTLLWRNLPRHLWLCFREIRFAKSIGMGKAAFRGKWQGVRALPRLLRKRKLIQSKRRVDADEIARLLQDK